MGIFGDASTLFIFGFFGVLGSFILQLIGLATPFWLYNSGGGVKAYSGLWQLCVSGSGSTSCATWSCDQEIIKFIGCTSATKGTQAMEILAFLALLGACVLIFLKLCVLKDTPILTILAVVGCFCAAALALIGVIVYATQDAVNSEYLHFSFAFCIIAAIGSIVAGVLLLLGRT